MPIEVFRAGWHPTPESVPRPRYDAALRPAAVSLPSSVDYFSKVGTIGFHLNNMWGDCTCAGCANIVQGITTYGLGTEYVVPDADVEAEYEQSGFNPNAGPPGENPTDNGWTCADSLAYLKAHGLGGHKIAAYGQAGYTDHAKVQLVIYEFGYGSTGVNLPQSAMDQFNAGPGESGMIEWTVSGNSSIIGGHCICPCGYTPTGPIIWTWNAPVQVSWAWWDTYVGEFWPVVSQEWCNAASQKDPLGVDMAELAQQWESAVGQNPFRPRPRH